MASEWLKHLTANPPEGSGTWLTRDELRFVTGFLKPAHQKRALLQMRIPFWESYPSGEPRVQRSCFNDPEPRRPRDADRSHSPECAGPPARASSHPVPATH